MKFGWMNRYLSVLIVVISAICFVSVFPPMGVSWLVWVVLVPLFCVTDGASLKRALSLSYLYGAVFFGGLMYWVVFVTVPGALVLTLYLAVYFPLFICSIRFIRKILHLPYIITAPILFCFTEYLRSIVMTGLPWDNMGYAFASDLRLIQIVGFTGVSGLSFLAVLGNVLIYYAVRKITVCIQMYGQGWYVKVKKYVVQLSCVILFFVVVAGIRMWGANRLEDVDSLEPVDSVKIALIQANIDQMEKWDARFKATILQEYGSVTRQAAVHNPDLIIWPESSLPGFFRYDENSTYTIFSLLKELKIPMVFGGNRFEQTDEGNLYFNSAYYVLPDNDTVRSYDKIQLVPYGEYIPQKKFLTKLLPRLESVVPFEDFTRGTSQEPFWIDGIPFGISICYEDIFPDLIRGIPFNGARFMVNITNDAWYLRSSAPYQHFSMSVFRAIENRIPLVRCANTGITGWVTPAGRSEIFRGENGSAIFEQGYKIVDVPVYEEHATFFMRHGEWFMHLCTGISSILLIISCIYCFVKNLFKIKEVKNVRRN